MARLGALKPLRGTTSALANIVLQEGELAFTYPSTGPGTGYGGIKMGDGTSTFKNLSWYITPEDYWEDYDEGTNEAALLNNIQQCKYEHIGKIYYIQSYMNNGTVYTEGATKQLNIPYKVIGINHEGTTNTVDLQAMVAVNYMVWNSSTSSYYYGRYTTSRLYNWVGSTCQDGYSSNIQAKMVNMTERWREATGRTTGTLQTRSTKVNLLNPFELCGSSIASFTTDWGGSVSDFTQYDYGQHYSGVFPNSIKSDTSRVRYRNTVMSNSCGCWTNSYYTSDSSDSPFCFFVFDTGMCYCYTVGSSYGIAPVIRLQG